MRRTSGPLSSPRRAGSWRFPKSVACIIATSARRRVQRIAARNFMRGVMDFRACRSAFNFPDAKSCLLVADNSFLGRTKEKQMTIPRLSEWMDPLTGRTKVAFALHRHHVRGMYLHGYRLVDQCDRQDQPGQAVLPDQ